MNYKAVIAIAKCRFHASATVFAVKRSPLIKFKGKRSALPKSFQQIPARTEKIESISNRKTVALPAVFGRPSLSAAEMEAVESGGATIVW